MSVPYAENQSLHRVPAHRETRPWALPVQTGKHIDRETGRVRMAATQLSRQEG